MELDKGPRARARRQVMGVAHSRNIPVFQSHNCGICALRGCLNCLKAGMIEGCSAKSKRHLVVGEV